MSYTYLSTTDIAPRFSDTPLVDGTEWNEAMAEFFTIHAECGIEVVSTGWSGALGKFVSIQTAPDVESANKAQVLLTNAGLGASLVTGPYISLEELLAVQGVAVPDGL